MEGLRCGAEGPMVGRSITETSACATTAAPVGAIGRSRAVERDDGTRPRWSAPKSVRSLIPACRGAVAAIARGEGRPPSRPTAATSTPFPTAAIEWFVIRSCCVSAPTARGADQTGDVDTGIAATVSLCGSTPNDVIGDLRTSPMTRSVSSADPESHAVVVREDAPPVDGEGRSVAWVGMVGREPAATAPPASAVVRPTGGGPVERIVSRKPSGKPSAAAATPRFPPAAVRGGAIRCSPEGGWAEPPSPLPAAEVRSVGPPGRNIPVACRGSG